MIWYAAGLVWTVQIFFWGIGVALLAAPVRWRRFWPAFCGPAGLALQSLVVWIGAHSRLAGTDSYAVVSQAIPAGLLLAAVLRRHRGARGWHLLLGAWRWWPVGVLMVLSLCWQAYPFTKPPAVLTSAAIGSCDAADYAAGARVFKEFARDDRTGFMGNTEIARTLSVDNFFDFWLRLNHFSPSGVIALNASLCQRQPYELTSLLGLVLLALHLPGVFWLARSAFRFGAPGGLGVTAIYGFSPALYYAVYQTALGQLMAAPAIALLTWAGWQAFRGPRTWRRLAAWSGLLLVGNWLLLGSYNFFVLFAYLPLLAYVGATTLRTRNWAGAWRWATLIGANLLVCVILFPDRAMSIAERFLLFNETPFGWPIPGFWPSGWFGIFADAKLGATHAVWSTLLAAAGLAATTVAVFRLTFRGRWQTGLLAAGCTLPILFGYWYLLREDRLRHDNSSYDAFKLFTVFYPGILITLCLWLRGPYTRWPARIGVAGCWAVLLGCNLIGAWRFNLAVRRAPLMVDPDLAAVAGIERMPEVASVNIRLEQVWNQLWANAFLLRKKQYLATATYEGRPVTALHGDWDLTERLLDVRWAGRPDLLSENRTYALVRHSGQPVVDAKLDQGWNPVEHVRGATWCWTRESATIRVVNPESGALPASAGFAVSSLAPRHLRVCAGERVLWEGLTGPTDRTVAGLSLTLLPGATSLSFQTAEPPDRPRGDPRPLAFRLSHLEVDVQGSYSPP